MTCKLEFLKASGYWTSGKKHEVVGSINNSKGMFGGWNNGISGLLHFLSSMDTTVLHTVGF